MPRILARQPLMIGVANRRLVEMTPREIDAFFAQLIREVMNGD